MNLPVETMFGLESKLCDCGLEVRHQQPRKRAGGEDAEDREKELFEVIATETGLRSQIEDTLDECAIYEAYHRIEEEERGTYLTAFWLLGTLQQIYILFYIIELKIYNLLDVG